MRLYWLILFLLAGCISALGNEAYHGSCTQNNVTLTVPGLSVLSQKVTGTFATTTITPCTVTVYLTGTLTIATIYADNQQPPTALANPFTCPTSAACDATGNFVFYAGNGVYDVRTNVTGSPVPPVNPYTIPAISLKDTAQISGNVQAVAYSSTMVFNAANASIFTTTISGNVSSSSVTNPVTGQVLLFDICQNGTGGYTFAWPANFLNPPTVTAVASACTNAAFFYDGTSWRVTGTNVGGASGQVLSNQGNAQYGDSNLTYTPGTKTLTDSSGLFQAMFEDCGGQVYNVKCPLWGAKGDGATNDTSAINLAIAACNAGKGVLFFPAGTYLVTPSGLTTVSLATCSIEGTGNGSTTIGSTASSGDVLPVYAGIQFYQHNQFIRNLAINCNLNNSTTGSGRQNNGLHAIDSLMVNVTDVSFTNCTNGAEIENNVYFSERWVWSDITSTNNTCGWNFLQDVGDANNSFDHSYFGPIYFNTYVSGDALFCLNVSGSGGQPPVMQSESFNVSGNMSSAAATTTSVFALSGGGSCEYCHIVATNEINGSGSAYVFNSISNSTNPTGCGSGLPCVIAGGSASGMTGVFTGGSYQESVFKGEYGNGNLTLGFMGTLTATSASSDTLTNAAIRSGSSCTFAPTNATAAGAAASTWIAPTSGSGSVTLTHGTGVSGATWTIACT